MLWTVGGMVSICYPILGDMGKWRRKWEGAHIWWVVMIKRLNIGKLENKPSHKGWLTCIMVQKAQVALYPVLRFCRAPVGGTDVVGFLTTTLLQICCEFISERILKIRLGLANQMQELSRTFYLNVVCVTRMAECCYNCCYFCVYIALY